MAALPSRGPLMATRDYYTTHLRHLGSSSSNSSCGSTEDWGILRPTPGSPPSHSWPQCWNLLSTLKNPSRPPETLSLVTWLLKGGRSNQSIILAWLIPAPLC
ncbi:pancreatic progenitor cell differentiation and proliferation factor-like [Acomys russatus]|uniref:pancreatic progenitor cell differentiation and proliferation factor-like n=1 Tax=Acomys russatus TaxID=60746 RepID=UPI0021E2DAFB|nr:pancreatic progenitor cell differentiation and proliferation factor-like [Acomys russatus]